MNEIFNEKLSTLVDGEDIAGNDKLVDKLLNDAELRSVWSRYHLIGDVVRGQLPDQVGAGVAEKVRAALMNEPTVLAPQSRKRNLLKPVAGLAIAASVAMVAVFSIQKSNQLSSPSLAPGIAVNTGVIQPQVLNYADRQVLPATVRKSDTPSSTIAEQRMNDYLMDHNEYRGNGNVNEILPYVRFVTIEAQE